MLAVPCLGHRPVPAPRADQTPVPPALNRLCHPRADFWLSKCPPDTYLVSIIDDESMSSSVQIRAVQSPTDRKTLGKKGFLVTL